jgi:transposase
VIDDAQLIALYEAQYTFREIGEQLGCGLGAAHARIVELRESGMDLPARMPRWTDERRRQFARMRREGRSLNELEIEFERTRGTITSQLRTLRRLGYDVEPSQGAQRRSRPISPKRT